MKVRDKIKEILKKMINNGEFERIIHYDGYSKEERGWVEAYYMTLKKIDIYNTSIIPILAEMPKTVAQNVLNELLEYEVKNNDK